MLYYFSEHLAIFEFGEKQQYVSYNPGHNVNIKAN